MHDFINIFRYRPRLSLSILTALVASYVLINSQMRVSQVVLLSLDAGIFLFLTSITHYMADGTPATMLKRARLQNTGKWFTLSFAVVISMVVVIALYIELHTDKTDGLAPIYLLLASLSIFFAWLFLAVMFALEYAHHFALNRLKNGDGLIFPGTHEPDYWDFVYFSVILSMAFQTADVQITCRHIRRMVLVHSVIAFFFNVVIISVCINIVMASI